MKPVAHEIFEIAKQRGFWLRCFLERKINLLHYFFRDGSP
jgi:hypothetical protein